MLHEILDDVTRINRSLKNDFEEYLKSEFLDVMKDQEKWEECEKVGILIFKILNLISLGFEKN